MIKLPQKDGRTNGLNWALGWYAVKTCTFSFSICFLSPLIVHNSLAENARAHKHYIFLQTMSARNSFVLVEMSPQKCSLFTLYWGSNEYRNRFDVRFFFRFSFRKFIRNVSFSGEFIFRSYFPYICSWIMALQPNMNHNNYIPLAEFINKIRERTEKEEEEEETNHLYTLPHNNLFEVPFFTK